MTKKRNVMSRRDFLRMSMIGAGTLAGSRLISACSPKPVSPTGVTTQPATATSVPTDVPVASLTPADIIKIYPAAPSKVVRTHHSGVWADKTLVPDVLRQMLDVSITKLTGVEDARAAWAALFKPGERIAIKVNAFSNSIIWTHAALVMEVTKCLQEAGIAAEQITIYDYRTSELTRAGFYGQ